MSLYDNIRKMIIFINLYIKMTFYSVLIEDVSMRQKNSQFSKLKLKISHKKYILYTLYITYI